MICQARTIIILFNIDNEINSNIFRKVDETNGLRLLQGKEENEYEYGKRQWIWLWNYQTKTLMGFEK